MSKAVSKKDLTLVGTRGGSLGANEVDDSYAHSQQTTSIENFKLLGRLGKY